jgi:hypothetical protein
MPQEGKRPYEDMAAELLNFIWNPLEVFATDDDARAYRLERTRTFLEMKFGHVPALQKEVEELRRWKGISMPAVVGYSEMRSPPIRFSYHPDQGDD